LDERNLGLIMQGTRTSSELRVEERYVRVDHDHGGTDREGSMIRRLTRVLGWPATVHLTFAAGQDGLLEMICAPTEAEAYKKAIADPATK